MSVANLSRLVSHFKCRNSVYPKSQIQRFEVPDDKVPWSVIWDAYDPPLYTSPIAKNRDWADPNLDDLSFNPKWNALDGSINRQSHTGNYQVLDNHPLNPVGRTGLRGRGLLGKWGPNHAADPIVTRWKMSGNGIKELGGSGSPILQFVGIERRDCKEWAIPGGMVDPGEVVSSTLKREFLEEALNSLEMGQSRKAEVDRSLESFFSKGENVYAGYVDDPRNTDNAWMETIAQNFHDEEGELVGSLPLQAGDDAGKVKWLDISKDLPLYASHSNLLKIVALRHNAHW